MARNYGAKQIIVADEASESANPGLEERPVRKRLVIAAACILALPLLFSPSQNPTSPPAFSIVALAGHSTAGTWCECGSPGCICDPGENPFGQSAGPVSDRNGRSLNQGATSARAARTSALDFGSSALLLALAFFVWTRFRA